MENAREPSSAGELSVESTEAAKGGVSRGDVYPPDDTDLGAVLSKGIREMLLHSLFMEAK